MEYLVLEEHRPFSYRDFMRFENSGQEYKMTHGTFRNNISCLMKEGLVEIAYRTSITFYTLRGVKFNKTNRIAMTPDHMGVPHSSASVSSPSLSSNPVYKIIRDLPLDKRSIHDIHLRFTSAQIYRLISWRISDGSLDYDYTVNARSQDLLLRVWEIDGILVKVSIHRTDTVSVVIGCSPNPIAIDINGIIQLTNVLSIVEDRLSRIVEGSQMSVIIPPHFQWIITMWHFGADASVEYSGEKFSVTWEIAENVLVRAYSKLMNHNGIRIRLERQEYPRTTLADAIEQGINDNQRSGD
jgi:hypothetical protein